MLHLSILLHICILQLNIIGPLSLSIKVPDTPAQFGMPYNLLCTVAVPMSSAPFDLNIRWKSGNTVMRNVTISNATYGMHESMLPFDSLNSSHMGMYWCEAGLGPLFSVAAQNVSVAGEMAMLLCIPLIESMFDCTCMRSSSTDCVSCEQLRAVHCGWKYPQSGLCD